MIEINILEEPIFLILNNYEMYNLGEEKSELVAENCIVKLIGFACDKKRINDLFIVYIEFNNKIMCINIYNLFNHFFKFKDINLKYIGNKSFNIKLLEKSFKYLIDDVRISEYKKVDSFFERTYGSKKIFDEFKNMELVK